MIFVTVGTQLPFDRLIRYIDAIAPELVEPVFAQIGPSTYKPTNIAFASLVSTEEINTLMADVSVVVGHAGIGTIITALRHAKPLVLVPRMASQGEHRNDHQMSTVKSLRQRSGIYLANTEEELRCYLKRKLDPPDELENAGSRARLISAIAKCVWS